MKFDYSKTINEQLPTFEYYKDRYCSYELELLTDRKEIERLNNIINELEHDFKSYELEYLRETYQGSLADFIETELKRIQELKEDIKEII